MENIIPNIYLAGAIKEVARCLRVS